MSSKDNTDTKEEDKKEKGGENKEEEEKKQTEPQKEEKLVIMKKGDYNVHILIEEVKNLIEIEENTLPVPRVKLTVFEKEQRTSKMKKPCDSFVFNEHFYFDKTNLTAEMLDSEKIVIEVYDNKHTNKKDYFGIYEFDFGYVYNQDDHAIHNIWIGLANPESDNISKVRGYLKLSISVLQESDQRVELEPADNELSNCLIPAQIQMKYKQISFYFFRGEQFPDMDSEYTTTKNVNRGCDGYIEVKYMGVMRKTKIVSMKKEIVQWDQIVDIPATSPAVSQKICMVVKDHDNVGTDDIVGSIEVKIDDIYNGYYDKLQYINIYGSPVNKHGGIYDQMNYNAEIGSRWNGMLLMQCKVTDVDSPIARVTDIPKAIADKAYSETRKNVWSVWVRIISAYFLPEDQGKYAIRISIQEKTVVTQPRKAVNGSINFCETQKILLNTFSQDKFELPDIFIYLVDKSQSKEKENVCFQRVKADVFYLNYDMLAIKLIPDPVIGKVSSMMRSGLLKCKICAFHTVNDKDKAPNFKDFESGAETAELPSLDDGLKSKASKPVEVDDDDLEGLLEKNNKPEPEPQPQVAKVNKGEAQMFTIIAVVYMSKGLVAAESNGTSDPFVVLTHENSTQQTSVKNNTMNGIWNEKLTFDNVLMNLQDDTTWPIFLLSVFDYNKFLSNVPLGYNYVWLSNAAYSLNDNSLKDPKWHNLFLPKSNKQQGQILLSFYIFDEQHKELAKNIDPSPATSLYNCELNILGLRQLKPLGMIEVKKPFIKFDLSSLNVTGKPEDAHANIQTVPVSGGANPTINTVIKFDTKLPIDPTFMPELQCEVYDHMLSGLHNSLLGVFTIDIKRIIKKTHAQIQEDITLAKKSKGVELLEKGTRNSISEMLGVSPGMSEKSLEDSKNELISNDTKSSKLNYSDPLAIQEEKKKDDSKLIELSKTINKENENGEDLDKGDDDFLEEDDDAQTKNATQVISDNNINMSNVEVSVPMKGARLSTKGTLKLDGNFLKDNLNDSKFFVLFPHLKSYKIPGYDGKSSNEESSSNNKDSQAIEMSNPEGDEKIQKEFYMEDLSTAPDKKLYFEIGYLLKAEQNINPEESTKHYRRIYGCPLENVDVPQFRIKSPFNVGKIRRGKFIDKKSETGLFDAMKDVKAKIIHRYGSNVNNPDSHRSSISSQLSQVGFMGNKEKNEKSFGKFKGLIRIAEKTKMQEYEKVIQDSNQKDNTAVMKNLNKYENLRKRLINKTSIIVRVYVLELNELAKKDEFSESDPYIKLYLNDKEVINERKNYKEDQKNCKWYKYYDIPGEIPGSSTLKIEVYDWDEILSDDLIGYTVIDLEDRYYNDDWQNMKYKPVEVRPLIHPDLNGSQGQVYMWLEMFDAAEKSTHLPWKIDPQPICELEVRFIVWETEDMEMMDAEGTSDIYVIGYIDQKELQKTDIHYRCQTGVASFNWRLLLPLKLPIQKPVITMQVYDKDIFSSDDYICGTTIDIKNLINIPKFLEMPISLTRDYYKGLSPEEKKPLGDIEFLPKEDDEDGIKFWVQCYKGKKEVSGGTKAGRVMCSLEILPKNLADLSKVGKGRDDPNVNPYLPPPVGRMSFTLNPFKMMNQCVGPKFRRQCYCYCLCCLLVVYLVFAMPTIFTGILF